MAKHHGFQATVNYLIFNNDMMSKVNNHVHMYNFQIICKRIMHKLFTNYTDFKRNLIKIKKETHFSVKATYRYPQVDFRITPLPPSPSRT